MCHQFGLSRSQTNRRIKDSYELRRSLDSDGQYVAHISNIEKLSRHGIAYIGGHVFSTEKDMVSAIACSIQDSKFGRTRESFENMFRCKDLLKSFRKLEQRDDIFTIQIGNKCLYLSKSKKEEQIKCYLHKKGRLLRDDEKKTITFALIFSVINYGILGDIESQIRKDLSRGGRKPFPMKAMVNAIMFMVMSQRHSYPWLSRRLKLDSNLSVALGFAIEQGTPSQSCFSKFVQAVGKHTGANIDKELADLLTKKKELRKQKKNLKYKPKRNKKASSHERNFT